MRSNHNTHGTNNILIQTGNHKNRHLYLHPLRQSVSLLSRSRSRPPKARSRSRKSSPSATTTPRVLFFVIVATFLLHDPTFHTCTALTVVTPTTRSTTAATTTTTALEMSMMRSSSSQSRQILTSLTRTRPRSRNIGFVVSNNNSNSNVRTMLGIENSFSSSSRLLPTAKSSSFSTTNDDSNRPLTTTTTTTSTRTSPSKTSTSSPPPPSSSLLFRIYYNDVYKVDLPPNHRFPMWKYERVRKQIQSSLLLLESPPSLQQQLQDYDDSYDSSDYDFHVSPLASLEELETTHSPEYIQRFLKGRMTDQENRNVGFPWSPQGVDRALSSVGGTIAAASYVCDQLRSCHNHGRSSSPKSSLQESQTSQQRRTPPWAAHVAGGTHHAFYDYGEGFSVFSDIGVAANVVLETYPDVVRNILIVDLDVHQGNGNAKLFQSNPNVFTFSIHCDANIFSKKEFGDLDIELPAGCTDPTYLMTLNHWLNRFKHAHFKALEQEEEEEGKENNDYQNPTDNSNSRRGTKNVTNDNNNNNNKVNSNDSFKIDLIFFQAGVDILDDDRLGRMDISSNGLRRRNEMVYQFAHDLGVPVVITMGGGYPKHEDKWDKLIDAHSNVYIQAYEFLKEQERNAKVAHGEEYDEDDEEEGVQGTVSS